MSSQSGGSGFVCESMSPQRMPNMKAFKPFCLCCVGKVYRKGYVLSKAKSRFKNRRLHRGKPRYKDHRA
ncbi:hypothetical protein EVB32_035 [Rhizobium phage RHph_TM39]|uniref:Uncharacterized protein n=2 Tax=Cuauhnahuacvirus TaxID=3044696 RepID=A0A7S5UYQ8_9CAUD|nr:hypothetical protein PQC16_gp035 [Rhizobium phage RHph_TM30]YP_010671184.1 hypothetical protein PQC17_gp035 [Rhizobium phage RHph_Y65]QIG71506.1 hypothetical protein EVB94_035 [Rhizobium phage RHph_TM40]QIG71869.1 hypothetical protein EVB95_035 [Rhizobium phage RHph_TM2_3B]QIG72231.1 hypothetical protein EVB96_035 [Rhizobium phage RHph_TM3_3_6]QIG77023.1 hypothetical protein EVB32_035 [Rhizobium phage RHph_TM39]QIG77622.1 hypothetical protein EVB64_035 [Rhizobium phage RHph_TM61]